MFVNCPDEYELLDKYKEGLRKVDPLLSKIRMRKTSILRNYILGDSQRMTCIPVESINSEIKIDFNEISNYDIESFSEKFNNFIEELILQYTRMVLSSVLKITEHTGNIVNAENKALTAEKLLESIEKTYIKFESGDDIPSNYQFIAHPDMLPQIKKIIDTDEFRTKYEELIRKKREEFYASKRNRKLFK